MRDGREPHPGAWKAKPLLSEQEVADATDGDEKRAGWWIEGPDFIDCEDSGLFFDEADARLAAAAPDLLRAADQALGTMEWAEKNVKGTNLQSDIILLRYALERARGVNADAGRDDG